MKTTALLSATSGSALMTASASLVAVEEKPVSVDSGPAESSQGMSTVVQRYKSAMLKAGKVS